MLTEPARNDFKTRKKGYGDGPVLNGIFKSGAWALLFTNFGAAMDMLFKQLFQFNQAALSFGLTSVCRTRHGIQQCGILLFLYTLILMIVWNSEHVLHWALTPLCVIITPFLPFFYEGETLLQWAVYDIKSPALLVYSIVFCVTSLANIVMVYSGSGSKDMMKRGESLIYIGLKKLFVRSKYFQPSEFFICCFVEPGLFLLVGYISGSRFDDWTFASLCFFMAGSEMIRQLKAKSEQLDRQAYLSS